MSYLTVAMTGAQKDEKYMRTIRTVNTHTWLQAHSKNCITSTTMRLAPSTHITRIFRWRVKFHGHHPGSNHTQPVHKDHIRNNIGRFFSWFWVEQMKHFRQVTKINTDTFRPTLFDGRWQTGKLAIPVLSWFVPNTKRKNKAFCAILSLSLLKKIRIQSWTLTPIMAMVTHDKSR